MNKLTLIFITWLSSQAIVQSIVVNYSLEELIDGQTVSYEYGVAYPGQHFRTDLSFKSEAFRYPNGALNWNGPHTHQWVLTVDSPVTLRVRHVDGWRLQTFSSPNCTAKAQIYCSGVASASADSTSAFGFSSQDDDGTVDISGVGTSISIEGSVELDVPTVSGGLAVGSIEFGDRLEIDF